MSLSRTRALAALILMLAPLPALAHHDNAAEHAAEAAATAHGEAVAVGALAIENAWSRATPPMANVAAGYMTLRNEGGTPERLLSAASSAAARVEIHFMEVVNDVMSMRRIEDGVEIPAGEEVLFAPSGYHLMLVGLQAPLTEGERVPVTLTFAGGTAEIELVVQGMGARSGPAGHAGH